ncbi:M24 family metallopeptidase [Desulfomonile tiedjei]|uniref:Xaa-Pro aminopeptidase n=1 Tax=Desulfomonile tiedjei (strain ATCC 49306 / DSM 6799 / DCB-1) TaxID=706587 RepID=I4C0Y0_DESTA|nr:Xaa-Pro peptidase family protein [Desulfomonile tiedjei]AFM23221.1 Xaa-Pro aminopeptidase [Desulfomonile tiedjei DSM 6799]
MYSTPKEEIESRISALQSLMRQNGFEGAIILQRADLFYYSGTGQDAHLFVPVEGDPLLLVRKSFERAVADSPLQHISEVKSFSQLKQSINGTGHGIKKLGMELDVLPVNNFRIYEDLFPGTEIADVSPLVKINRMVKSPYELAIMKRAAELNTRMFSFVLEVLKEGMTEMELSAHLEAFYRQNGHQGFVRVRSFNQEVFYGHVMSGSNLAVPSCSVGPTGGPGTNASMPQGAGLKPIGRHEPVSIDYVGSVDGYIVDQARTFYVGEPPEKFVRAHNVAIAIQEAVVKRGLPGTAAEELYDISLEMAKEAELLEGFQGYPPVPFLGHGVGLELDEFPVIGRKSPHILQENMVVAIEPKFIFPGEGMAGIENTFVVTASGLKRITHFDDSIQVVPC